MEDHIDALAELLVNESNWRSLKAEEYPNDARNRRATEALADAARELVERRNDVVVRHLAEVLPVHEGIVLFGESCRRVIRSYGFGSAANVDLLVDDLRVAIRTDALQDAALM